LQQQKRLEEERLAAEQRLARERAEQQRLREQALRKQEEARLRHTLSMQPVESPSNVASNQKRTPVKSNQSKQVRASRPAQVQVEPSVPPVKPESEKPTQAASVSQAWHERLYQAVLSRKKEDVEVILGEKTLSEGDNEHLAQAFILLGVTQEDCVGNPITMAIRKLLVEKGAFKASMGQEGGLIFYAARHNEYYLMSACLIQAPELLTAKDREGKTPLVIAAESDSVTMCRLLLGQDASCSRIPFKDRVLALSHAAEKRAESTFSDLLKHVMHMGHTLFALLEHAHAEDLEGLCHRLVALHSGGRDGLGHSLLYRAIRANNESLTFYLERQGVSFTESEKQEFQQERNVSSVRFFAPPPLITLVPVMIVPTLPTQPQSDSFEKMRSK
ncbi:MAG: hypothetical protein HY939_04730, partial [Gammaproteobacteria bacterium]|nr:hypothetical protein [Gammaproteobacteria bacterium]